MKMYKINKKTKAIIVSFLLVISVLFGANSMNFNKVTALAENSNPIFVSSMRKSQRVGEIKHSATGWLYGLSEDNIPSRESITALKPQTLASKNKDGLQHPTGDVWRVSDTFFDAGGSEIQVYLQDHYLTFPYNSGIRPSMDDYLKDAVLPTVKFLKDTPNASKWAFVPFNEADWIWYQVTQSDANLQAFCNDWKIVYNAIKAEWSDAKVVGPNFAFYFEKGMTQFINYAVKNDCVPQVITWHELEDDNFNNGWYSHIQHYRDLEASAKIGKKKVVINEYAEAQQCSVPGELVKYISGLEQEGVYGCLPYWNIANNLDDLMADYNTPNAAWWLYKWYADMSGEVVNSYSDYTKAYGLKGLTSIDEDREMITSIFGGSSGNVDLEYNNLNASAFKDAKKLHVNVQQISWSGYDGEAIAPITIFDQDVVVSDNKLKLTLPNLNKMDGFKVIITMPTNENIAQTFNQTIEAESNLTTKINAPTATRKEINSVAWEHFAMSYEGEKVTNGDIVSGIKMNATSSEARFTVTAPKAGKYKLGIIYGGYSREYMTQTLTVNDEESVIKFDPTINVSRVSAKTITINLKSGDNLIKLKNLSANIIIDRFYISDITQENYHVSAANSDITQLKGSNIVSGFGKPSAYITSVIVVDTLGNYDLSVNGVFGDKGNLDVSVNNLKTGDFAINGGENSVKSGIFLNKGVNIIKISANVDCQISGILATYSNSDSAIQLELESGELKGSAAIESSSAASGGKYVTIGGGKENSVTTKVNAQKDGIYKLVMQYSSNDAKGAHIYNIDSIDPYVQLEVNGVAQTNFYRSSYHWDKFITTVIDINLTKGENILTFYNDNSYKYNGILSTADPAPRLDKLQIFDVATAPQVKYDSGEKAPQKGCGCGAKILNTGALSGIFLALLALGLVVKKH